MIKNIKIKKKKCLYFNWKLLKKNACSKPLIYFEIISSLMKESPYIL